MSSMRAVQVAEPGGPLELVDRQVPEVSAGEVRVRVEACGICHSDMWAKEGVLPSTPYPIVPGHEIVGTIDEVGPGVRGSWQRGQRVGVGWFGGACYHCESCRRGDFITCANGRVPGITFDGGYAEAVVVPADALARMPEQLSAIEAAPLLCAGVTTYHALRESPARPGDRVAVLGVGGLGHLGIQFAARMGMEVVAISRGAAKAELARDLGAHEHIDSDATDPGQALAATGGATVVLATAASGAAAARVLPGLAPRGQLLVLGAASDPLEVAPPSLITPAASIVGHPSGTSKDSEDTLRFSRLTGVRPMIDTVPLDKAAQAYERMMSNQARFRVVLTM
ncbi:MULTISPECIES: alcohol dehydrogenase catalytic domain-containing protein [Actinopolyspora]|uniref:Alcohol dehydrogenase n=1 Tax=Actinopolyspora saharensis TaxID=995062 RepID=A0A1H0ZR11_9ACTN|nr:alcohol dehydrogenase catalytic domain-containing protein [Actinopolyspora sp. BKK2]NHE75157.1 alcohol dehydrogenase catalytic domain-containing protein [Actinopolyspora sp. BKK1]SDQ29832.1 alcohol dehydrogenase [Actinopolyspora saharensis]